MTSYEMRISDWSSDVCSSDLSARHHPEMNDLIVMKPEGLYCPAGDFYIDPHKRVTRAVVTHAHGDHAQSGCARYWTAKIGRASRRRSVGQEGENSGVAGALKIKQNMYVQARRDRRNKT